MRQPFRLAAVAAGIALVSVGAATADTTLGWTDQHDGGAAFIDDGFHVLAAPDGDLIVGGESTDLNPGADLFIRKLARDDGSEIWSVRREGIDEKDMAITEMTWDSAGQLLVSAFIRGCIG